MCDVDGIGDMACHVMDPAYQELQLTYPSTVESFGEPKENSEGFASDLTVKYEFPDRGDALHQRAVTVFWHHGNDVPQKKPIAGVKIPEDLKLPGEAVMLIGEKGTMIGVHGKGVVAMLPQDQFAGYKPPEVERGPSHEGAWMQACKGHGTPGSNFDYASKPTETILLGNVAWKVGKKLEWDAANMRATNAPEADPYVRRELRKGWEL